MVFNDYSEKLLDRASAQSRQNLRYSLIQAVSQEEPSDRKPDPWPLWMAGHAQLKFVMTEFSKTQIRLTGLFLSVWHESSYRYWVCENTFLSFLPLSNPSVVRRPSIFRNTLFSETTGPIYVKFHVNPHWDRGTKVCSNNPGHMTNQDGRFAHTCMW